MSAKEPTRQYLHEQLQAIEDAQPMTAYCLLCPEWEAHRAEFHPERVSNKKIVRRGRVWSQAMTAEREREIEEERRQRMRTLGI